MVLSCRSVWGARTVNGSLYTGRNLDWLAQSGIADYKLVTVRAELSTHLGTVLCLRKDMMLSHSGVPRSRQARLRHRGLCRVSQWLPL